MSRITVNGIEHEIGSGMEDQTLLTYLREELDLTGTKNGCSEGTCGACTVLVNYKAVRACRFKMSKAHDAEVLTIEGLIREDGSLHPLQQAFIDAGAVQCGFCRPWICSIKILNPTGRASERPCGGIFAAAPGIRPSSMLWSWHPNG
jgi:aerobic-type carbon monoxide dehydrogenase small subunit (CoxS/CutS family)